MDRELIEKMAEDAKRKSERAKGVAKEADQAANSLMARGAYNAAAQQSELYHSYLNDSFYWLGQMNAYKGIAEGLEEEAVR